MTYSRIKEVFRMQVFVTELEDLTIVICMDCDKTKKFASVTVNKYDASTALNYKDTLINGQIKHYLKELMNEVWIMKILGDIDFDFNYKDHKEFDSIREILSPPLRRTFYGITKIKHT